jgi:hypothetical protein
MSKRRFNVAGMDFGHRTVYQGSKLIELRKVVKRWQLVALTNIASHAAADIRAFAIASVN